MQEQAEFNHLDRAGRASALAVVHSRWLVYASVSASILLSWAVLLAAAAEQAKASLPDQAMAGGWLLRTLPDWLAGPLSLCLTPAARPGGLAGFTALALMWCLMAVAMMLPSGAPLIRTYCEIADTAQAKGEPVVHPLVLIAGYLSVWFVASLLFAGTTVVVQAVTGPTDFASPYAGFVGAGALAIAGLYQFTGLKDACLKRCRSPFATLFARWTTRSAGVFRLGAEQGLWCLGCCWALMLVMFAVGLMNVFWMALIGLFTMIEKSFAGRLPTVVAGAILLVWSAALLLVSR